MLVLSQAIRKKTEDAALTLKFKLWQDRSLSTYTEVYMPEDPHWLPDPSKWKVKAERGRLWWRKEAEEPLTRYVTDEGEFKRAFGPVHRTLETAAFFFGDAGVFPPVPSDEAALRRLTVRPARMLNNLDVDGILNRPRRILDEAGEARLETGRWCLQRSSALGDTLPDKSAVDPGGVGGLGRLRMDIAYRSLGLKLAAYGCHRLSHRRLAQPVAAMTDALKLFDDLCQFAKTQCANPGVCTGDVSPAWAVFASGAAAIKLAELLMGREAPVTIDRLSDKQEVREYRQNTGERLESLSPAVGLDPRFAEVRFFVADLLNSHRLEEQLIASDAVEALEFIQQARNAQHAVGFKHIWA
jgi:hypothetical protein